MIIKGKIKIRTPVHIGTGERFLTGLDCIQRGNYLYIIDIEELGKKAGIDRLYNAINREKFDLGLFIRDLNIEEITKYKVYSPYKIKFRRINEQIKSIGKPVIPGSSIKGAIRTAIWHYLMKREIEQNEEEIENLLRNTGRNREGREKVEKVAEAIEEKLVKKVFRNNKDDTYNDIMRFLGVGDVFFRQEDLIVMSARILSVQRDRSGWWNRGGKNTFINSRGGTENYLEMIKAGSESRIEIRIDDTGIELNKNSINKENEYIFKNLVEIINEYAKEFIEDEIRYYEDRKKDFIGDRRIIENIIRFYNGLKDIGGKKILLNTGWGTGWRSKTGNIWKGELLRLIRRKFKLGRRNNLFPKTRRIIIENNKAYPPGWIEIIK